MLRVLHLIYDDPGNPWVAGGGAVRVREIYRRLLSRLGSIAVATGAYPGARNENIDGIAYRRLGAERPYSWSRATYTFEASRLLARAEYDVAVFDFSTYVPLRLPRDRPIGVTVHHVTAESAETRWGRVLGKLVAYQERKRLQRCRTFSATSLATERRLRAIVGPEAVICRVGAGVPDELFDIVRHDLGYVLYFGRLDWFHKGLDTLLGSFAGLVRRYPELELKIAGRGKDRHRVTELARELGIAANVELVGPVGALERNQLLAGARLLMMPSRFEGFGMVAAEAMAAGVPVVGTAVDSLPEVVDPPRGGMLVAPGDSQELSAVASRLIDDRSLRETMSRSARESAERFRWDRVAEQHLEFLETIRAGAPSVSHPPTRQG